MTSFVLDASALIALIKQEAGADKVAKVVQGARIGAFNFAEVVSHFIYLGLAPREVGAMLRPLPVEIVVGDADLAREAGYLRAVTRSSGLSLGDRFCLALAKRDGLPAWTSDRQWLNVAEAVAVEIILIR